MRKEGAARAKKSNSQQKARKLKPQEIYLIKSEWNFKGEEEGKKSFPFLGVLFL